MNGPGWIKCRNKAQAISWLRWGGGCIVGICGRWYARPRSRCKVKVGGKVVNL